MVRRVQLHLRAPIRPASVEFYPYTDGKSTVRERDGGMVFRLSDRLQGAPDGVLEGVVSVLLCKIHRLPAARADPALVRAYKRYLEEEREAPRGAPRGRKHIEPVGHHRSLLESYLRVSMDMGLTLPRVPTLSWSQRVSRRRLGHWDPDHGAIVISQILDDPRVPEFVLDYVVYHEMLHVLHPVKMGSGTKRRIHTAAFLRDERRFPQHEEGDEWLRRLSHPRWKAARDE
jgi:hypothetical protein